ncbi:MAG TPA: type II toxin-antitoxin system HipA family toxin [Rhodopila sp.]
MTIPVWFQERPVASIEDGPVLRYDPEWLTAADAFPISVRMPLAPDDVPTEILVPWLQNLLPESGPLDTVGRALGVARGDILGLLERIGRDTAGALTIGPQDPGETPNYRDVPDDASLERIIDGLPARPFLAGDEGVSMSLAGAQDKLPVAIRDGRVAVPTHGAPSTHILKPDNPRLSGSVQNEALCLTLAAHCGLPAAEITTGKAGARSYLLVTRYDRVPATPLWQRLHQEDFCQALGRPPSAKYQHNQTGTPGPSLADFFGLTRTCMTGADTLRLLDAVIFNVITGNVDSHAKNYSMLIDRTGFRFAPLYDLMCGAAWESITLNHAQSIGGQRRGMHIQRRHWQRMAADCGLNATATIRRVIRMADLAFSRLDPAIEAVRNLPAGGHHNLDVARDEIRKLCVTVRRNAERDTP